MLEKRLTYVRITGTGLNMQMQIASYEIMPMPAGTYFKFIMPDGTEFLLNDFGVRSVTFAESPEKLQLS